MQSRLVVTVVIKVAEYVCVSVIVSADRVPVVRVATTAGPTMISLLAASGFVSTSELRVTVTSRGLVLVIVLMLPL